MFVILRMESTLVNAGQRDLKPAPTEEQFMHLYKHNQRLISDEWATSAQSSNEATLSEAVTGLFFLFILGECLEKTQISLD